MQTQVLVGLMMFPMAFWMLTGSTIVEEVTLDASEEPVAILELPEKPPADDSNFNSIDLSTLKFDSMEHSTLEPSSGILSVFKSKFYGKKRQKKAKNGNKMVKGTATEVEDASASNGLSSPDSSDIELSSPPPKTSGGYFSGLKSKMGDKAKTAVGGAKSVAKVAIGGAKSVAKVAKSGGKKAYGKTKKAFKGKLPTFGRKTTTQPYIPYFHISNTFLNDGVENPETDPSEPDYPTVSTNQFLNIPKRKKSEDYPTFQ